MRKSYLKLLIISLSLACSTPKSPLKEEMIKEIMEVEKSFNDMAAEVGLKKAFLAFAADDAVLLRGQKIIIRDSISSYFDASTYSNVSLKWKPDFVEVAKSGDLAYTYGEFTFSATAQDSTTFSSSGIFHTVWKRQPDGSWKFVWD